MEATMNRNSLLTLAAVATLVAVSSTVADARGGGGGGGGGGGNGMGASFSRPNVSVKSFNTVKTIPTTIQHKTIVVSPKHDEPKRNHRYYPIEFGAPIVVVAPVQTVVAPVSSTGGTGGGGSTQAAQSVKSTSDAGVTTASGATTPTVGEDGQTGAVDMAESTAEVEPEGFTSARDQLAKAPEPR